MNSIDYLIIIILILAFLRGLKYGFLTQVFSIIGFFGGLYLGSLLAAWVTNLGHGATIRAAIALVITFSCGIILSSLGELAGSKLRHLSKQIHLEQVDAVLGAIFEIGAALVAIWLVASPLSNLQLDNVAHEVRGSRIIAALERKLPAAPNAIAKLEHLIEPNGFPKVFLGPEPAITPVAPPSPEVFSAAVAKSATSVVKIEGLGCGGIVEGSGFVAANGTIVTNAHVIAGIPHPSVIDRNGRHDTIPVYFDPNLDLAILRVNNLAGSPLSMATQDAPTGTQGAVLGYPGGGPFSATGATVLDEILAIGRNIYGTGTTTRQIYEVGADVQPGNSGGPLINVDGTVIGVVFAKSESDANVGYSLTSQAALTALRQADGRTAPVDTGACSSG